jgi:hypothetical protein
MFDQLIKSTTAVPDSTLGNVDPSLKSGRAIDRVVQNAQMSTSNFLDNLARAMQYEAQVINGKLYPIYGGKPDRLVRIMTGEGEEQTMQVSPEPEQAQRKQQAQKVARLTKDATFNIAIKLTKNADSRRTQEYTELGQLLAAEPQLLSWFGDLYFKTSDMPGRLALAERAKAMLAPPIQQMLAQQDSGKPMDPAAQAQIQQLQQQLQQVTQLAQQAHMAIQTKQVEQQAKVELEKTKTELDFRRSELESKRDIELQRMKDATTIAVAQINAQAKGVMMATEAKNELTALHAEQAHDLGLAVMDQAHQQQMAEQQHQQAQELTAQQAAHQQDAAVQQAALQPPESNASA